MRKKNIILMVAVLALAACNRDAEMAPVEYTQYDYDNVAFYQGNAPVAPIATNAPCSDVSMIKYSVPNDGDLVLETAHHVIQIEGTPNKSYAYYVWAGDKDYSQDPDLIVEDGIPAVLRDAE